MIKNKFQNKNLLKNISDPSYRKALYKRYIPIFALLFVISFITDNAANRNHILFSNPALAESVPIMVKKDNQILSPTVEAETHENTNLQNQNDRYTVQAVLGAKQKIVIASGIDAKITKFKLESGDSFKRGDVLVEYDCSVDRARLKEALSRQRVTEQQLNAYDKLTNLGSASDIELVLARENNEQNKAIISQIKGRLKSCQHIAPWNGRVMRTMASQYEYVQTGRVLMEIASKKPLHSEFIIPSRWLQWLNIDTPVDIYIGETNRTYSAKVINVFGEVDPVSQSIQIVAEMEKYHEDLLPGMSGTASFSKNTIKQGESNGFLGLNLSENRTR